MHSLKRRGEPRLHEPLSGSFQQAASPCRGPTNFPQLRYRHGLARALATKKKNEKTRKRKKTKKKKKKQIIIKLLKERKERKTRQIRKNNKKNKHNMIDKVDHQAQRLTVVFSS